MPAPRTLSALTLTVLLLGLVTTGDRAPSATLPLPTPEGKGWTAALLTRDETGTRFVRSGPAVRRADHFRAGSITKTFVATVVLQLAAEHRLTLSDTVEEHLPGVVRGQGNDGRAVTLRALLQHTSGLYDYTKATRGVVPVSAATAVRLAVSRPPGRRGTFSYSNTGYVLLGMVIERVTGEPYATAVRRRVLDPLGLTGTSLPGARRTLPEPHGRAWTADGRDVTTLDPRVAGASGELVTTLDDLDRFYAALLGGRLLPATWLARMLDTGGTRGAYGLGVYPLRLSCGVRVWGHDGRIAGSYVRSVAVRGGGRVATYRVDTDRAPSAARERAMFDRVFCGR